MKGSRFERDGCYEAFALQLLFRICVRLSATRLVALVSDMLLAVRCSLEGRKVPDANGDRRTQLALSDHNEGNGLLAADLLSSCLSLSL